MSVVAHVEAHDLKRKEQFYVYCFIQALLTKFRIRLVHA
jgi:hypothetical protein